MDTKYDGHTWCKVIITNIKNNFGLSFRKARHLGHLWCLHDDCENFVHIGSCNEIFWCNECTHIPIVGQMALSPFASSFACKFYHFPPLCVVDCLRWIYYVVLDYQQSLDWLFISGSTSILWWMASAKSLWTRLKGWSQRRSIACQICENIYDFIGC